MKIFALITILSTDQKALQDMEYMIKDMYKNLVLDLTLPYIEQTPDSQLSLVQILEGYSFEQHIVENKQGYYLNLWHIWNTDQDYKS